MVKKEKQSRYLHGGLNFGFSIPRMSATRIVFLHHKGYESGDYRLDKYCTEETCLETVVGMDTRFYYQIQEYSQGILLSGENYTSSLSENAHSESKVVRHNLRLVDDVERLNA